MISFWCFIFDFDRENNKKTNVSDETIVLFMCVIYELEMENKKQLIIQGYRFNNNIISIDSPLNVVTPWENVFIL